MKVTVSEGMRAGVNPLPYADKINMPLISVNR